MAQSEPASIRPSPDPTTLTTEQLLRENFWLRELLETRLDGMDKALVLLQARADRVPSETDLAVLRLRELTDEKFQAVTTRFGDSKTAVDVAFTAQKEAAAKTETSTTKQIDQIKELAAATFDGLRDKIDGVISRMDRGEGRSKGLGDGWGYIFGAIGAIGIVATVVIELLARHT